MQNHAEAAPGSRKMLWTGRIISALPVLMLLFSGAMKLMKPVPVVQGFAHYGYPERLILLLGFLEIASTTVYMIPQTTVLGAISMTGYLRRCDCDQRACGRSLIHEHGDSWDPGLVRTLLAR